MEISTAKKLLLFVNTNSNMEAIALVVTDRLNILRKQLENSSDINDIMRTQGRIQELNRLLVLRDEVVELTKAHG